MIIRPNSFRRVTIIGVGFMGGSLGMAIKKHNLAKEVVGLSHRQSSLVEAMKVKAIDVALTDVPSAVRNSDLIILATPVESIIRLLSTIKPHLKRGCIITDLGSAKSEIVDAAESLFSHLGFYVGSHPLVGSEKRGVENSRDDLFEKSVCIMTPTKNTNKIAKEKVKLLWSKLGAEVKYLAPGEHDEILAYISHLPHLMAFGLVDTIPNKYLEFAAQGLKDTTRIAASSPQMWGDICTSNARNLVKSLDELVAHLGTLRKAIVAKDKKALLHHFQKAKEKRDSF